MTAPAAGWHIVPFNSKVHDRSAFSCGAPELDTYIRRLASQDMRRDVARVFVATEPKRRQLPPRSHACGPGKAAPVLPGSGGAAGTPRCR